MTAADRTLSEFVAEVLASRHVGPRLQAALGQLLIADAYFNALYASRKRPRDPHPGALPPRPAFEPAVTPAEFDDLRASLPTDDTTFLVRVLSAAHDDAEEAWITFSSGIPKPLVRESLREFAAAQDRFRHVVELSSRRLFLLASWVARGPE